MSTAVARPGLDHDVACGLLARSDFFVDCGREDIDHLALHSRFEEYSAGVDIVREGDTAKEVYIIESGHAAVLKRGNATSAHEMAQLGPGACFGEMEVINPCGRSATVRALDRVRILVVPIEQILALAKERPSFVPALFGLARLMAVRLRATNDRAVHSLERALAEEQMRVTMGKFIFLLIVAYSLYTWLLGAAMHETEMLGRSELVTVPVVVITSAILLTFMKLSKYPPAFFGITLKHAPRDVLAAVVWTLPLMMVAVLLKMWLVAHVPAMHGQPIFKMFSGDAASAFNPWLALAYVAFAPFQELIYRGGLQGALEHFLTGRWRSWLAIFGSNIIFSSGHLYISVGLSVTAFLAGLFWGWLYSRQRRLAGVAVSHMLLGFFAFEVVGLGVLA
jgi:CRP-like cAMP-binding protein/membrane protease YdiL (CAAX protease family)